MAFEELLLVSPFSRKGKKELGVRQAKQGGPLASPFYGYSVSCSDFRIWWHLPTDSTQGPAELRAHARFL